MHDNDRDQLKGILLQLLDAAFTAEQLVQFCRDHFPGAYQSLQAGVDKLDKAARLIDYCARHRQQFEALVAQVERHDFRQYDRFARYLTPFRPFPDVLEEESERPSITGITPIHIELQLTEPHHSRPSAGSLVYAWLRVDDEDFDIFGKDVLPVSWSEEQPQPVRFMVRPRRTGYQDIRVELYHESTYLGRVIETLPVDAGAATVQTIRVQATVVLHPELPPPDLLIRFYKADVRDNEMVYRYRVSSPLPELQLALVHMGSITLNEPATVLRPLLEDLDRWAKMETVDRTDLMARLQAIGLNLQQQLVPRELNDLYWRLPRRCRTIQIIADARDIPWEMLCFQDATGKAEPALATQFAITRWHPEVGTPVAGLQLDKMLIFVGQSVVSLTGAEPEATALATLFGSYAARLQSDTLGGGLTEGAFDVLHLISHGYTQRDDANESYIEVGDGKPQLRASDLSRYTWMARHPLLFVNACHVGREGISLTGLGGWATAALVQAQAGAFIGALWQATDGTAGLFATAFYTALLDGATIGEAVHRARQAAAANADPTWLCYAVYAHPNLRLVKKQVEQ